MNDFHEKLSKAAVEYYRTKAHKSLRFGQYFVNHYLPDEYLPWPALFYETDSAVALAMLCERFGGVDIPK